MDLQQILPTAASALSAESKWLNTIASNLANAGNVGATEESTYHKKIPIFQEISSQIQGLSSPDQPMGGVEVSNITHSKKPLDKFYDPNNPLADKDGFIFKTDVNPIEEMTNMIAASKEYEANVNVMNTAKTLFAQSLNVLNTK